MLMFHINIPESQPILNISKYATKCVLACSPHCMCVCVGGQGMRACVPMCVCGQAQIYVCVFVNICGPKVELRDHPQLPLDLIH